MSIPTILLVDDEPNVTAALRRAMHKEPWRVLQAPSAEEALVILARERVDVIVTDENMAGLSGSEFLALVCREYPDTIRIMLTGNADLESAVRAINEGGIYRFFLKPANVVELSLCIHQALQARSLLDPKQGELRRIKERTERLRELAAEDPAIYHLERDENGAIIIDDEDDQDLTGRSWAAG